MASFKLRTVETERKSMDSPFRYMSAFQATEPLQTVERVAGKVFRTIYYPHVHIDLPPLVSIFSVTKLHAIVVSRNTFFSSCKEIDFCLLTDCSIISM